MTMTAMQPHEATQPVAVPRPMITPPGWYPDAYGVQRFWDGRGWTEHIAPPQPVQVAVFQQQYPARMVTKSKVHTSHTFHLLMTVLTGGFWGLFVWLPMIIINSMRKEKSVTRSY